MKFTAVGVDITKNVFQVHYVDEETGEIVSKPLKRAVFLEQGDAGSAGRPHTSGHK